MRVVIVTESFPPDVNGVAHCALQTARHLVRRGHTPLVIAPAVADPAADADAPCAVVRVPSLPFPAIRRYASPCPAVASPRPSPPTAPTSSTSPDPSSSAYAG